MGRPLPKFGEWDVNNPASAEGFTVIFNKARDDKKTTNGVVNISATATATAQHKNEHGRGGLKTNNPNYQYLGKSVSMCNYQL